jgi:hypothetical protein
MASGDDPAQYLCISMGAGAGDFFPGLPFIAAALLGESICASAQSARSYPWRD